MVRLVFPIQQSRAALSCWQEQWACAKLSRAECGPGILPLWVLAIGGRGGSESRLDASRRKRSKSVFTVPLVSLRTLWSAECSIGSSRMTENGWSRACHRSRIRARPAFLV
jgi:hypothetical protein